MSFTGERESADDILVKLAQEIGVDAASPSVAARHIQQKGFLQCAHRIAMHPSGEGSTTRWQLGHVTFSSSATAA